MALGESFILFDRAWALLVPRAARAGVRKPLTGDPGSEAYLLALLGPSQCWFYILCSQSIFSTVHLWLVFQSALCSMCLGSHPRSWELPEERPLQDAAVSSPRVAQYGTQNIVRAQKCSWD